MNINKISIDFFEMVQLNITLKLLGTYLIILFDMSKLPRWLCDNESACNTGDRGSIPGSGRYPGEGNGKPLQYSCLGNPIDFPGITKSQTQT